DRAADAAGAHQDGLAVDPLDQVMIDADLAELVDQDSAVGITGVGQHVAKQRRLARAEEAGDEVDRNSVRHGRLPASRDSKTGSTGRTTTPAPAFQTAGSVPAISRRPVALLRMKVEPCQSSRRSAKPPSTALASRTRSARSARRVRASPKICGLAEVAVQ